MGEKKSHPTTPAGWPAPDLACLVLPGGEGSDRPAAAGLDPSSHTRTLLSTFL